MGLLDLVTGTDSFREPAACKILIDGMEISDYYGYVSEVRVNMSRATPATCTLVLDTMRDEHGSWLIQDARLFIPWKKLDVIAAFGSNQEETVFNGYIREVRSNAPEDMSAASVTVIGQDESILLDRLQVEGPLSSEEAPGTDGDIVARLSQESGLVAEVEPGLTNRSLNNDRTNISFIRERSAANGFEFYVRDGTVYFKPPLLDGEPQAAILVYAGRETNCLSFSVNYDYHKPDNVRVIRAAETGTEVEEEVYSPNLELLGAEAANSENMGLSSFEWRMQQPSGSTLLEAQSRAQAKVNENAWKVSAEGELDGSMYGHVLLTHKTVEVDGMGESDSGRYYVDEVTHLFTSDGYRQKFKLLRNAIGE